MSKDEELVTVYTASGEGEANIIKSLLESYGIPCILRSHAARSVHSFTVDGMAEIKVMIWKSMVTQARQLIKGKDDV